MRHLKARLKVAAHHMDKSPLEENLCYAMGLVCCQWVCCSVESKWNNEEGGLSPNSSGKPEIISQTMWSWVQLGDPTEQ